MKKKTTKDIKSKVKAKPATPSRAIVNTPTFMYARRPADYIPVEEIINAVLDYVDDSKDVYLAAGDEDFMLLIKKKVVNITETVNKHSFQPLEKTTEETLHSAFIIEWGKPEAKVAVFDKLIDMKIKVFKVRTVQGAINAIMEA